MYSINFQIYFQDISKSYLGSFLLLQVPKAQKACSASLEQNKKEWNMQGYSNLEKPRVLDNAQHSKSTIPHGGDFQEL